MYSKITCTCSLRIARNVPHSTCIIVDNLRPINDQKNCTTVATIWLRHIVTGLSIHRVRFSIMTDIFTILGSHFMILINYIFNVFLFTANCPGSVKGESPCVEPGRAPADPPERAGTLPSAPERARADPTSPRGRRTFLTTLAAVSFANDEIVTSGNVIKLNISLRTKRYLRLFGDWVFGSFAFVCIVFIIARYRSYTD